MYSFQHIEVLQRFLKEWEAIVLSPGRWHFTPYSACLEKNSFTYGKQVWIGKREAGIIPQMLRYYDELILQIWYYRMGSDSINIKSYTTPNKDAVKHNRNSWRKNVVSCLSSWLIFRLSFQKWGSKLDLEQDIAVEENWIATIFWNIQLHSWIKKIISQMHCL